jgi:hypothetical protein
VNRFTVAPQNAFRAPAKALFEFAPPKSLQHMGIVRQTRRVPVGGIGNSLECDIRNHAGDDYTLVCFFACRFVFCGARLDADERATQFGLQ